MVNLLFIEDEEDSIQDAINILPKDKYKIEIVNFDNAKDKIASSRPDILVLDIRELQSLGDYENPGVGVFDFVWNKHFCPVIVYSAFPELIADEHPFVKKIIKGTDSPEDVLKALEELRVHVDALRESENYIKQQFSFAMREVAPYAFDAFDDPKQIYDTIKRSGRRRLAALMDESTSEDTALASWEQYLCPPVSKGIMLGDILQLTDGNVDDPSSFRVVLTPSCDMVATDHRKPKVEHILVAKCCTMKTGLDSAGISYTGKDEEKVIKNLGKSILSQGSYNSIVPFPELKDKIPIMAANLRQLELIPIEEDGTISDNYSVIASLDSPFRELVSWAYLQVVGRPGLPDRDFNTWANEIIESVKTEGENSNSESD